jgi:hypothetical protein
MPGAETPFDRRGSLWRFRTILFLDGAAESNSVQDFAAPRLRRIASLSATGRRVSYTMLCAGDSSGDRIAGPISELTFVTCRGQEIACRPALATPRIDARC